MQKTAVKAIPHPGLVEVLIGERGFEVAEGTTEMTDVTHLEL